MDYLWYIDNEIVLIKIFPKRANKQVYLRAKSGSYKYLDYDRWNNFHKLFAFKTGSGYLKELDPELGKLANKIRNWCQINNMSIERYNTKSRHMSLVERNVIIDEG